MIAELIVYSNCKFSNFIEIKKIEFRTIFIICFLRARIKKFSMTISEYLFDRRTVLNIRMIPGRVGHPSWGATSRCNHLKHTMAWNSIASRVQRSPTGPLAREICSTAESIGFGVIAVSRLSAQNTIRQEDSEILCLPCPALREKGAPARHRPRAATCLFGVLLSFPLVTRPDHRLPHETVSRPVDWTTYGSDPFRFSRSILPTRMESAWITFLLHLYLWVSRRYSWRYTCFRILDE